MHLSHQTLARLCELAYGDALPHTMAMEHGMTQEFQADYYHCPYCLSDSHPTAFARAHHFAEDVVIAFRGTNDLRDWLSNVDIDTCPLHCEPCHLHAHAGFLHYWRSLRHHVISYLRTIGGGCRVTLTGHSLGGAAALLAGYDLLCTLREPITVVTFGAPRSCYGHTGNMIHRCAVDHTRYVIAGDPVPGLPRRWHGYRHDTPATVLTRGPAWRAWLPGLAWKAATYHPMIRYQEAMEIAQ